MILNNLFDLLKKQPGKATIELDDLTRYREIEILSRRMVELLEDGKVDYDLLRRLKAVIDG